jgi:nucleoside-diphosphate-sugar epimerase
LRDGHEVVGIDNFATGRARNLAAVSHHPRFRLIDGDVSLPVRIDGTLDWVLHFASPASPPKYLAMPIETMRVNSEGTRHLLELAAQKGGAFLYASTSEVYGDPNVHPQPESYWGNVNPFGPRSVYDESKRFGEALTLAIHKSKGIPIRIPRIFNTYGPNMDPADGRVVSNLVKQAINGEPLTIYGEGTQTRSFQYVDDLVEGIVRLMNVDYQGPVNLGNPTEFTILELAKIVREETNCTSPIRFADLPTDDPRQRRPDISLARRILDWEPRVALREGLRCMIEAFRSERGD